MRCVRDSTACTGRTTASLQPMLARLHHTSYGLPPPTNTPNQEFNGGPCCMQFGCMVYRGYYPMADERLRATFLISPVQDALPAFLDPEQDSSSALLQV